MLHGFTSLASRLRKVNLFRGSEPRVFDSIPHVFASQVLLLEKVGRYTAGARPICRCTSAVDVRERDCSLSPIFCKDCSFPSQKDCLPSRKIALPPERLPSPQEDCLPPQWSRQNRPCVVTSKPAI